MRLTWAAAALIGMAGLVQAQQQGPVLPPLEACGMHGELEVICGARSPEDLELTPDGKFLIVSQYGTGLGQAAEAMGLMLFDPAKKTFTRVAIQAEPKTGWGATTCPGPIGEALEPHGTSLRRRSSGEMQLFVVNHGGRESIEMFEVRQAGGTWELAWHGCVPAEAEFNDVAALADGGFVGTQPLVLQQPGADLFAPEPSGYVVRWSAAQGIEELPGTRSQYANGVVVSADERYAYIAIFPGKALSKYDLREGKRVAMVDLDFMPDNMTWTTGANGPELLAAGIKGIQGDCPAGSGVACIQGFGVAAVDPATMKATNVFDSAGKRLIQGVSVALQMGDAVYIGSYQGDRLARIARKQ